MCTLFLVKNTFIHLDSDMECGSQRRCRSACTRSVATELEYVAHARIPKCASTASGGSKTDSSDLFPSTPSSFDDNISEDFFIDKDVHACGSDAVLPLTDGTGLLKVSPPAIRSEVAFSPFPPSAMFALPMPLGPPLMVTNIYLESDSGSRRAISENSPPKIPLPTEQTILLDSQCRTNYSPSAVCTSTMGPSISQELEPLLQGAASLAVSRQFAHGGSDRLARCADMGTTLVTTAAVGCEPSAVQAREPGTSYRWFVDARKLRSSDKSTVSPPFELILGSGGAVRFKLSIHAKVHGESGRESFRGAGGKGNLQLKCEDKLCNVGCWAVCFSIGGKHPSDVPNASKTVHHEFDYSAACNTGGWDFAAAVDATSGQVAISVEIYSLDR